MKVALLVLWSLAFFDVFSCEDTAGRELSDAANCFSLKFFKRLDGQSNMISSPFSVDVLLSMLLLGAGGRSAEELSRVLGYQEISLKDMQDTFGSLLEELRSGNGNILEIANSLWTQQNYTIKKTFQDAVLNTFRTKAGSVDFRSNSPAATRDINEWVKTATHGKIPVLFDDDLSSGTVMVLVNAVYFKGIWSKKFNLDNTVEGEFLNNGNEVTTVKFMNQQSRFPYKHDKDLSAKLLELDYAGGNTSMLFVLPDAGVDIAKLEHKLTCKDLKSSLLPDVTRLVDVTIPRFEIASDFYLEDAIKKMGIRNIFGVSADLSGISSNVRVSTAVQKAVVKVNEEGSEAAAASGMSVVFMSAMAEEPEYFMADRPFLFLIRHKPTGLILFMGKVQEF